MMRVTVKDSGWKAWMKALRPASVRVGIFGARAQAQHHGSTQTVGEIAATHEAGRRAYLRPSVNAHMPEIQERLRRAAESTLNRDVNDGLKRLGSWFVGVVRTKIESNDLVDTGQLRDSVSYEVVDE